MRSKPTHNTMCPLPAPLRRLQAGQKVGPWVLVEVLKVHQKNCVLWTARRRGAAPDIPADVVLKFKRVTDILDEFNAITRMMAYWHNFGKLPVFDIPGAESPSDYFGTLKDVGWIAMVRYETTLANLSYEEATANFRGILLDCLHQLQMMHETYKLVHMDLKTENILIRKDAATGSLQAAIADFGLTDHKAILATKTYEAYFDRSEYAYVISRMGPLSIRAPIRPRMDLEALGIGLGLVMNSLSYDQVFGNVVTSHVEDVELKRKWENLKGFIPSELHAYFEYLQKTPWEEHQKGWRMPTYDLIHMYEV